MKTKNEKRIRIQPEEMADKTLPYPYFIDSKGLVGRQDFWRGKPYRLLGFSKIAETGTMDLSFKDFWGKPKKAIGIFPVFADKKDSWTTQFSAIESVKEIY